MVRTLVNDNKDFKVILKTMAIKAKTHVTSTTKLNSSLNDPLNSLKKLK